MSIFDDATIESESPEVTGQEEFETAETTEDVVDGQEPAEVAEVGQDAEQVEEESPSLEEQGEEQEFDYVKGYQELRREFTRKSQELADIKRQVPPPMQQQQGQGTDLTEQFWTQFQQDPVNTLYNFANAIAEQRVQQVVAPIFETQAQQTFAKNMESISNQYPELKTQEGYQKFTSAVQEIAQDFGNPNLVQNPSPRVLKMAAQEAFGESKAALYQKAKAKGREEALNTIRNKQGLAAQTGAKPKETPKSIEEQLADSIVSAGRRGGIFG